jgi:hypothetical protein
MLQVQPAVLLVESIKALSFLFVSFTSHIVNNGTSGHIVNNGTSGHIVNNGTSGLIVLSDLLYVFVITETFA